jgi:hypothetical protein
VWANVIRDTVLQYKDDAYSDWEWVRGSHWVERHPPGRAGN